MTTISVGAAINNMKKEELVEIFSDLHPEDTAGIMTGEVHLLDGTVMKTDSL